MDTTGASVRFSHSTSIPQRGAAQAACNATLLCVSRHLFVHRRWPIAAVLLAALATTPACKREQAGAAAVVEPTPAASSELVKPLPPADFDVARAELGKQLFHDTRLSGDATLSCASCHSLDHGGAEPRVTSIGINGQIGPINSPTVLNARHNFVQFWDGRAADLLEQAAGPVLNPVEMGGDWSVIVPRLQQDADYPAAFAALYPDGITQANTLDAIVEYEKSLVTPSRFDDYLNGDATALSPVEIEGYQTFKSVGCTTCHQGINVGGTQYQRMGVYHDYFADRGNLTDADLGRFNVTGEEQHRHVFKVPTLRNIALTAPYLHDGSQDSLASTVQLMGKYQLDRELTDAQVTSIVAFLHALTGELPASARPAQAMDAGGDNPPAAP